VPLPAPALRPLPGLASASARPPPSPKPQLLRHSTVPIHHEFKPFNLSRSPQGTLRLACTTASAFSTAVRIVLHVWRSAMVLLVPAGLLRCRTASCGGSPAAAVEERLEALGKAFPRRPDCFARQCAVKTRVRNSAWSSPCLAVYPAPGSLRQAPWLPP
jgi:hypothetical protein